MFYRRCDLSGLGTMVSIDQKSMSLGSLSPFTRCYFQSITDILHAARADSTGIKHTAHDPERLSVSVGDVSYLGMRPVRRHFSRLNIVAMSFNISNSWVAISASLAIAISAGGTATLIYGIPLAAIAYAATGASLAEMASCYPTAGGQ
jgi:choline transport protein